MRPTNLYLKNLIILGFIFFNQVYSECPDPYSYCSQGKEGYINVHLVPHTHDDVGWLKTVDQYFYGSNTGQQKAGVQYILDSVIQELDANPERRFVYVEIAYFWRWWNEQNNNTKQLVRKLVDEHRLEFVIGAWCMNDEATTYYNDIIDQQTLGLKFILKEFGECARPRSAWQVDPFGHSREQASLFAQFGFDGLFLGRIDYQDSDQRSLKKTREMLWKGSQNLPDELSRIFTGVLPNTYNPPPGFCFDDSCDDDPIMDDPNLEDYNVQTKVALFTLDAINIAKNYKTNNIIMTMGSDFQYSNAHMWYKNLDKLIYHVNEKQKSGGKINVFYSTTACYLYSLYRSNQTWPVKTDDFFPYANRDHSYWTGYFTSRAALKYYVRQTNSFLQSSRHLIAVGDLKDNQTRDALGTLERAMGVAQHHDAVSGTERQHVADDYAKRLSIGTEKLVNVFSNALNNTLVSKFGSNYELDSSVNIFHCSLLNISECQPIENKNEFQVITYNPLPRQIQKYIQIPVTDSNYQVFDSNNLKITSDIISINEDTFKIPERQSKAKFSIIFQANLPPLGFRVFTVKENMIKSKLRMAKTRKIGSNQPFSITNKFIKLSFDKEGNLNHIENSFESLSMRLNQSFCKYDSMPGNNIDGLLQASGAYIFRPLINICENIRVKSYRLTKASQFTEVHQEFDSWISQTIRLYNDSEHAEFEWQVGPIDIKNEFGKELVMKFETDLKSNSFFYTDSNGREILQRKRNFRPTWKVHITEKVAGNYYPINSRIFIRDEDSKSKIKRQLTLVTDRSEGGSSVKDGEVEIMLHRRLIFDDSLGVSEPLNEHGSDKKGLIVRGKTRLLFSSVDRSASLHRELSHRVNNPPLILVTDSNSDIINKLSNFSYISSSLPSNLHLLTLTKEKVDKDEYLLVRLEHFYELNEDPILSKPVEIDISTIFSKLFSISRIEEYALGANMKVEELDNKLKWISVNDADRKMSHKKYENNGYKYIFTPMQIRTFRIYIN